MTGWVELADSIQDMVKGDVLVQFDLLVLKQAICKLVLDIDIRGLFPGGWEKALEVRKLLLLLRSALFCT